MNIWKLLVRMLAIGLTWSLILCLILLILDVAGFMIVNEFQKNMRGLLIVLLIIVTSFLFALEKHG